jgi:hypothetical protein
MSKLWLTYAWRDNEQSDVDHVINELRKTGLTVGFDRAQLLAGQRLWPQIDSAISDPQISAWAIYVTENSLKSEPCQEELAYALDRALRTRGGDFPLIGIFPQPLDRSIIPSAIATRLYVNLRDPNWSKQVYDGVKREASTPDLSQAAPYGLTWHKMGDHSVLEVWPKSGRWCPFSVVVPVGERGALGSVLPGPKGYISGSGMVSVSELQSPDGAWEGIQIGNAIDALTTAQIFFKEEPSEVMFGDQKDMYSIKRLARVDYGCL